MSKYIRIRFKLDTLDTRVWNPNILTTLIENGIFIGHLIVTTTAADLAFRIENIIKHNWSLFKINRLHILKNLAKPYVSRLLEFEDSRVILLMGDALTEIALHYTINRALEQLTPKLQYRVISNLHLKEKEALQQADRSVIRFNLNLLLQHPNYSFFSTRFAEILRAQISERVSKIGKNV